MNLRSLIFALIINLDSGSREDFYDVLKLIHLFFYNLAVFSFNHIRSMIKEGEFYRPYFHFTPQSNWMNDPNGMFYLNGEYHLYFQYHPNGNVWGPMHWGHAISKDLITWEEQPIAIYPDNSGYIFSGCCVVDHNNSSGLGSNNIAPIIALFTYHDPIKEKNGDINCQNQGIAFSLDGGQSFKKYNNNPVLVNPNIKDFRDPKVIFDEKHEQWLMVIATHNKALFYSSKNLIDWELLSTFGEKTGAHNGVWECPDFFPINIEGTNEEKWVLIQSIDKGAPNGGSGTQYFIGDFNGKQFTLDPVFEKELNAKQSLWLDYGRDNYAGVTWANIPKSDNRKLFIGWMSNWEYADKVPTEKWRGAMTLPRELSLKKVHNSYKLTSTPVTELANYLAEIKGVDKTQRGSNFVLLESSSGINRHDIQLHLSDLREDTYTFIASNDNDELLEFGLNNILDHFFINRFKVNLGFSDKFASKISTAPIETKKATLEIRIIFDKTSIEIFYDDGIVVMTEIFFTSSPLTKLVISATSEFEISGLSIREFQIV